MPLRRPRATELRAFLASDDDREEDVDYSDDANVFVEIKAGRYVGALGLPLPEDLSA